MAIAGKGIEQGCTRPDPPLVREHDLRVQVLGCKRTGEMLEISLYLDFLLVPGLHRY
jgi:hypothetical protein